MVDHFSSCCRLVQLQRMQGVDGWHQTATELRWVCSCRILSSALFALIQHGAVQYKFHFIKKPFDDITEGLSSNSNTICGYQTRYCKLRECFSFTLLSQIPCRVVSFNIMTFEFMSKNKDQSPLSPTRSSWQQKQQIQESCFTTAKYRIQRNKIH